ncbi:hypothetical protein OH76DRAFT_1490956 [Lentinus brumalis]|uniref:F-box domain-containing protein n=1 Tax=Lentinus brumalis TaxID=2498619 RepID=A0A371CH87_9APHY|nr:hypothetical protein OH76DRAFT_1490956 [Polyporus brumalis]
MSSPRFVFRHPQNDQDGPNDVPSANRVPNEVLIIIFTLVLLSEPRDATYRLHCRKSARVIVSTLFRLTHVCQRWREVITGLPHFWTRMDGISIPLKTSMSRSQTLPLSLFVRKWWKRYLKLMADEGHRVERLDLAITSVAGDIVSLFRFVPTVLECLTISYSNTPTPSRMRPNVSDVQLFNGPSANLKALAISTITDWFPSNQFPALTHLYLSFFHFVDRTTSRHLLLLLSGTPKLKYLHVDHLVGVDRDWRNPISLASLRSIVFQYGSPQAGASLLTHIQLSQSTLVRVDRFIQGEPFSIYLPRVTDSAIRLEVGAHFGVVRIVAEGRESGLWVQGEFSSLGGSITWLHQMLSNLPLHRLTHLRIFIPWGTREVLRILSQMESLAELEMNFYTMAQAHLVCVAMCSDEPCLCPILRSINFDICIDIEPDVHQIEPDDFHRMLADRARNGHPICRISVRLYAEWENVASEDFARRFPAWAHDDVLEVHLGDSSQQPHLFDTFWEVREAERYWDLEDAARAYSMLPWRLQR